MQQVYKWVQGEKENSLYMCTKSFKSNPKRSGEPSCLDHFTDKRSTTIEHMFSNCVSIPTHKETKNTVLDPKGLASTYLGIQYLATQVCNALNLSCELAWCKCWLQWKGLRIPLEPCFKGPTREERWVLLQAKRQRSLEVVGEEPTQAPWKACRGPTQERLETCPRAWPNSLERVS
jgi:hypothetical protein